MDRREFIKKFNKASDNLDMTHINKTISDCFDEWRNKYPQYERGHMNLIAMMEEFAELIEALSRRMRNRTTDNYDLLEEMADVIIGIWCICDIYGISHKDIRKAINVKIEREKEREYMENTEKIEIFNGNDVDGAYWNEDRLGTLNEDLVPEGFNKYKTNVKDFSVGDMTIWARSKDEAADIAGHLSEADIRKFRTCYHVGIEVKIDSEETTERLVKLILTEQDEPNLTVKQLVIMTALPDDDIIPAIKAASKDYLNTPEGKEIWEYNNHNFNYGDFDLYVPNDICLLHGFYRVQSDDDIITDDFNTQLAKPDQAED